ncbi:hypothetical protein CEXT_47781 [Caerostris extrusa]|uniref:Tc1-like transposase DDE domain-containing protein n=1 Tax=Caerostris extrusa TaxID=172846 RepID=A0AAV4PX42_CAEEX|nr:hypothetical protein CEXT_47781 [Caerostris extrusa]
MSFTDVSCTTTFSDAILTPGIGGLWQVLDSYSGDNFILRDNAQTHRVRIVENYLQQQAIQFHEECSSIFGSKSHEQSEDYLNQHVDFILPP